MPALIIIMAQVRHGVILQKSVDPSSGIPNLAAWMIAFCSA
jgi:hypothetical protein